MKLRHWKFLAALATATVLLAGFAGSAEAKLDVGTGSTRGRLVQGRNRLLPHGAARGLRRRVHPGPALRARLRDPGQGDGQRPQDRADDRRRRHRSGEGRRRRQGPDRQGLQDPRRQRLVGRRAPDGAARRAEQGALHLRPGRHGRDHRHQQVHLPLRAPDLPGREDRGDVPQGHRQERDRLRAGLGRSAPATSRPST